MIHSTLVPSRASRFAARLVEKSAPRRELNSTISVLNSVVRTIPMLRLSKLTDYGTVAMAHIAREPDRIHAAAELAAAIGVTVPPASKILQRATWGKLLQAVAGPKGDSQLLPPAH